MTPRVSRRAWVGLNSHTIVKQCSTVLSVFVFCVAFCREPLQTRDDLVYEVGLEELQRQIAESEGSLRLSGFCKSSWI